MIQTVLIDIDNTLLSFDAYVKQTMKQGFEEFHLKTYEDWMYDTFHTENDKLWRQIEEGTLQFEELKKIRWNKVFEALDIDFDGVRFETYFRDALYNSAILEKNAIEMLEYLKDKYTLCVASNGPYEQQLHRLEIGGMKRYHAALRSYIEDIRNDELSMKSINRLMDALEELKQDPSTCMIIGDSLTSDMQGGLNSHMHTCFYQKKETEVPDTIEHTITDLLQIKEIL